LLALVVVSFILHILITANIFFYRYLQLCRSKYFVFYSTKKGFLSLLAINLLIIFNWACYIYFCLFPYDEIGAYVREPVRNIISMDLYKTAFLGFCVKVRFIG
uniref:G_PROTEIN_RECEP_F1_2 domain-containing protein n=1 Tax=Haemonchus placei TaxID=6290 RepID=A0A0N4WWB8_HAEPC